MSKNMSKKEVVQFVKTAYTCLFCVSWVGTPATRISSPFIAFHCISLRYRLDSMYHEWDSTWAHSTSLYRCSFFPHFCTCIAHIFIFHMLASVGKCWQVLATQPSSALHLRLFWVALRNVYASPRPCLTLCMQTGTRSWWMKWLRTTLGLWRRR
jgi:hypothetical protein